MPAYATLKSFWETLSANWTPLTLENHPYLMPIHDELSEHRDRNFTATLSPNSWQKEIRRIDGSVGREREIEVENPRLSGSPAPERDRAARVAESNHGTEPVEGKSLKRERVVTKEESRVGAEMPHCQDLLVGGPRKSSSIPVDGPHHYWTAGLKAAVVEPSLSRVTVHGEISKDLIFSPPHYEHSTTSTLISQTKDNSNTSQTMHQTHDIEEQTRKSSSRDRRIHSRNQDIQVFDASPTIWEEALQRLHKSLSRNQFMGTTYDGRPSAVSIEPRDVEAAYPTPHPSYTQSSDPRQPLLYRIPPPDQDSSRSSLSSPDSYSSSDMPEIYYSPRRREARQERTRQRRWWEINFDEWNACLGVYLMGFMVVFALGVAIVGIWILLHQ
jgi:hypothetical protein